ncbi:MAG: hypothetical protein K5888_06115 [Lachnospiraceae bacterium]|nr:hypothetical protein [Lachnospiraceae bacterium]
MRYYSLSSGKVNKGTDHDLSGECREGHTIGPVTVSKNNLFIKKGLRRYYIPYAEADRIFRRVRRLHANICCGDGDIEVEYLVIGVNGIEAMEVTLPGKKAARMLMDEIRQAAPGLDTAAPKKEDDDIADPDKADNDTGSEEEADR